VRLVLILPVLLIMVLPKTTKVAMAANDATSIMLSSHPGWLNIESPTLIMLGCFLVFLAVWVRRKRGKH
jgi:hypothetical protein